VLWSRSLGQGILAQGEVQEVGTPLALNGYVYEGSPVTDQMTALNAGNGRILWRTKVGSGIIANPVLVHDLLIVATENGHIMALRRVNGRIISRNPWDLRGIGAASPLIVANALIQTTSTGWLAVQQLGD